MRIRLAIGEQDSRYLNNFVGYLQRNYMDKIEIFSFSNPQMFQEYLTSGTADVILLDEDFGVAEDEVRRYGKVAYLSEGDGVISNIRRIAKFKKPDLIYKDILDLYAEGGNGSFFSTGNKKNSYMVMVTGLSGGTGASTFAAVLAKHYALTGKKVLYLNLEPAGMSSDFFEGSGTYTFGDIIFALKSQQMDVSLKVESAVRKDSSGVNYFAPCEASMDMVSLTQDKQMELLSILKEKSGYDYIVVDQKFQLSEEFINIFGYMNRIVLIQDGGQTSNSKFRRSIEALQIMEQKRHMDIIGKMQIVYNRFSSSKSSAEISGMPIPVLGKIPPVKHASLHEIMDYMMTRQEIWSRF